MSEGITPDIGEAAVRLMMSDSRIQQIIDELPNGRLIVGGLLERLDMPILPHVGRQAPNHEGARRDLLVALGHGHLFPARRYIAAASYKQFGEYCKDEGLNPRDQNQAYLVRDRFKVAGLDRGIDLIVLPGAGKDEKVREAIEYLRDRRAKITMIPPKKPRNDAEDRIFLDHRKHGETIEELKTRRPELFAPKL